MLIVQRFIDNIPGIINLELLSPLSTDIRSALIKELDVFGEDSKDRCKGYLDEAPDVAELRRDLTVRKARLGESKVAFKKFKMKAK